VSSSAGQGSRTSLRRIIDKPTSTRSDGRARFLPIVQWRINIKKMAWHAARRRAAATDLGSQRSVL
jgi:hypothetical protein